MVIVRQISDQNGRRRGECSEKEVGGMVTVAPPTVGWREDANCYALSWSTERNPMTTSGVVPD